MKNKHKKISVFSLALTLAICITSFNFSTISVNATTDDSDVEQITEGPELNESLITEVTPEPEPEPEIQGVDYTEETFWWQEEDLASQKLGVNNEIEFKEYPAPNEKDKGNRNARIPNTSVANTHAVDGYVDDYVFDPDALGDLPSVTAAPALTREGFEAALAERAKVDNGKYANYFNASGGGYYFREINGRTYINEDQGCWQWASCKNGNSSTVKGVGCFMFACSTAANNLLGTTYCVADVAAARGLTNCYYDNGAWHGNIPNVGWSGGWTDSNFFTEAGLTYTPGAVPGYGQQSAPPELGARYMAEHGFNNSMYILYGHNGLWSTSNAHFVVCVGMDDQYLYVLCNFGKDRIPLAQAGYFNVIAQISAPSTPVPQGPQLTPGLR